MRPKMAICRKYLPNAAKKWHAYWCGNYEWYRCFYRRRHRPNFTKSRFILGIFSLNLVMFLLSYVPVFPAFYKLRKIDPDTPRPFKVSGSDLFLKVLVALPMIMIVISLIFTALPLQFDAESLSQQLPITIGAIVFAPRW